MATSGFPEIGSDRAILVRCGFAEQLQVERVPPKRSHGLFCDVA